MIKLILIKKGVIKMFGAYNYGYTTYELVDEVAMPRFWDFLNDPGVAVWMLIALILAVIGGVLVYFLFVKAKEEPKGKFLKWLKDFLAFKIMWIEPMLKILYYMATIFTVLSSFGMIGTSFASFVVTLIAGPIAIRLVYELAMVLVKVWQNTQTIADNTKKK